MSQAKNTPEQTYLPEGQLLSTPKNREMTSSLQALERAMSAGAILEGMSLLCDGGLNLRVDLPAIPEAVAIIPKEEAVFSLEGEAVKDIAILTRVGKAVCFKVIGIDIKGGVPHVTLSRRAAQAECAANYLSTLVPGDIIPARVTHMESFGAFVDVGCGIPSLLSVDTISVSRISHPSDRLRNGQFIHAVVRAKVDGDYGIPRRIFVSTKELLGTWEENAASFRAGQTVVGIVRSVEDYGAFVELAPNLTGLAELKEGGCGGISRRASAESLIGKQAAVFIKSIQPDRMKVKLVLLESYVDGCVEYAVKGTDGLSRSKDTPLPPPLVYYVDPTRQTHISHWLYSPPAAQRRVESVFDEA